MLLGIEHAWVVFKEIIYVKSSAMFIYCTTFLC